MSKIIIGGAGTMEVAQKIREDEKFVIVENEQDNGLFFSESNPYIINRIPPIANYYGKEFVCKGRHEYRRVVNDNLVEWVCQCGRKTTD